MKGPGLWAFHGGEDVRQLKWTGGLTGPVAAGVGLRWCAASDDQ